MHAMKYDKVSQTGMAGYMENFRGWKQDRKEVHCCREFFQDSGELIDEMTPQGAKPNTGAHYPVLDFISSGRGHSCRENALLVPDHYNDPIKDVVWIFDVAKRTVHKDLQEHLQSKETCEDYIADLQGIGELLRLVPRMKREEKIKELNNTGLLSRALRV